MDQATVSILMPTFEPNPSHLRSAIDSILRQTHTTWTLFICDDASSRDISEILQPYLSDPRITFKPSKRRHGIGGNWNQCLSSARGEFVQFLFQDDIWKENYLEKSVAAFADPMVGFTVANHAYASEGNEAAAFMGGGNYALLERLRNELRGGRWNGDEFLREWVGKGLRPNLIGEPSFVMLRKNLVERIGTFREDLPQGLDVEYWVRALARTDWYYLREILGTFRIHSDSASMRNEELGHGLIDRLMCFDTLLSLLPTGETREVTKQTISNELKEMMIKARKRVVGGNNVGRQEPWRFVRFAARHPVLTLRSMAAAFRS